VDDIRLKLSYTKHADCVIFTVIYINVDEDIETVDPKTRMAAFNLRYDSSAQIGHHWSPGHMRLPVYARAIAAYNKRSNVCSTEAPNGVIY
jgi:hypothetical protein